MRRREQGTLDARIDAKGGAYTDLADLIRLRYAAREIGAMTSRRTRNPLSGLLTSNFRGRGIDFAEVRAYQPGDDIRSIDWRVTARTDQPHTKLFQEEKERPVLLMVDQSQSMFFGSRIAFKSVLAAEAAALIAWASLERGDRTGGIVFSDRDHREVRPRRSKHSVLRLLNEINDFNRVLSNHPSDEPANEDYLAEALRNIRRVARHGSSIYLFSDFVNLTDEASIHLNQLARHNQIIGFSIADPLEAELPAPDLYTITNGDDRIRINTGNSNYRDAYHSAFEARQARTRDVFARARAPLIELTTAEPVTRSLVGKYNAWLAQSRSGAR